MPDIIKSGKASILELFSSARQAWRFWIELVVLLVLLAPGLAWISNQALAERLHGFTGWGSFLVVELLCAIVVAVFWALLRSEHLPRWLALLVVCAALLRLLAGVIWYTELPRRGHGTQAELNGYVMGDANERDQAAWKLARSERQLTLAFTNNRLGDQYGGLLFLSSLVYRHLGSGHHQPLLMVVVSASMSALAVLFTWALSRRAWNNQTAGLAAWLIAIYPEAVLMGSSQMREAFTVSLGTAAFYGLVRYQQEHSWKGLAWIMGALLLYLPFSPPFTALLLGMLVITALLVLDRRFLEGAMRQRRFWVILTVLSLLILAGLWLTLSRFTPEGMNNPLAMLSWWARKSADLQAYLSQHASGWLQKIFRNTPEWMHLIILLGYGVMQPFLPAALVAGSEASIWTVIAIWRAAGWTLLLALLLYAPLLAFRHRDNFARALSIIIWAGILIAAFRGGADMWDNPRYREAFAGLQIALAAWAWQEQRRSPDAWLRRAIMALGAVLAWFLPWYLRRYFTISWPVIDLFKTLGLGFATAFLLILWDWLRAIPTKE